MPGESRCIIDYRPLPGDGRVYNPYLREVTDLIGSLRNGGGNDIASILLEHRSELISKYSFSIPVIKALEAVAALSPIVEIGAGSGYWAMCLSELGADIIACDSRVPGEGSPWDIHAGNQWHQDTWYPVDEGDERAAALYPGRALLLCWPPPESPMACNALTGYLDAGGSTLIYIGSPRSTGDAAFHACRGTMKQTFLMELPGWPYIEEILSVHHATGDGAGQTDR